MDTCRAPAPQLNIEGLQEQDPTPAQQRPRLPPRKRCKLDIVKGEMGTKLAAWCRPLASICAWLTAPGCRPRFP